MFYFDAIIQKLKKILRLFKKRIEEIEKVVDTAPFENVIKIVSDSFEYIFKTDYLYKSNILLKCYKIKNTNQRYSNAIEMFLSELKLFLIDKKKDIESLINDTDRYTLVQTDTDNIIPEIIHITSNKKLDTEKIRISYSYEMGKLVSKDDVTKFRFFSSLLKTKCKDNELVLAELHNMEINLDNDLEYYCSYHLIDKLLND